MEWLDAPTPDRRIVAYTKNPGYDFDSGYVHNPEFYRNKFLPWIFVNQGAVGTYEMTQYIADGTANAYHFVNITRAEPSWDDPWTLIYTNADGRQWNMR